MEPQTAVAAWVLAADTEDEAQRLAASHRMAFKMLRQGRLIPVPTPEKALRYLEAEGEPLRPQGRDRRAIVGAIDKVRAQVEELADAYKTDEVIVVTITHDHAARRRSYELLADAFDLQAQPAGAAAGATDQQR
jgi:alkanesulfonate monooxygenase SsuD/methylene tetrahydromethanopterin reductase-like flavin-dependent oxidoreductase (luciferase family)